MLRQGVHNPWLDRTPAWMGQRDSSDLNHGGDDLVHASVRRCSLSPPAEIDLPENYDQIRPPCTTYALWPLNTLPSLLPGVGPATVSIDPIGCCRWEQRKLEPLCRRASYGRRCPNDSCPSTTAITIH